MIRKRAELASKLAKIMAESSGSSIAYPVLSADTSEKEKQSASKYIKLSRENTRDEKREMKKSRKKRKRQQRKAKGQPSQNKTKSPVDIDLEQERTK